MKEQIIVITPAELRAVLHVLDAYDQTKPSWDDWEIGEIIDLAIAKVALNRLVAILDEDGVVIRVHELPTVPDEGT